MRRTTLALCALVMVGVMSSCKETNKPEAKVKVTGITINPTEITMLVGATRYLAIDILPVDATIDLFTIKSSNDKIVKIGTNDITAIGVGETTITVTTIDGGFTATCKVTTVAGEKIEVTNASGFHLYEISDSRANAVTLHLTGGSVKSNGVLVEGEGVAFVMDLITPATDAIKVPVGTYNAFKGSSSEPYDFLLGRYDYSFGLLGTYIYKYSADTEPEFILIVDGEIIIEEDEGKFAVMASVVDSTGKIYTINYYGDIPMVDYTPQTGVAERVIEMKNLTQGQMIYFNFPEKNWSYWTVYLSESTLNLDTYIGPGEFLRLDLLGDKDITTVLTPGEYIAQGGYSKPLTVVLGYWKDGNHFGTWYGKDLDGKFGADTGRAIISKSGNIYTIDFEFTDNEAAPVTTFKGSYTGELTYVVGKTNAAAAAPNVPAAHIVSKVAVRN